VSSRRSRPRPEREVDVPWAERIGAEESALRERAVLDPAATVSSDVERLRSADAISERVAVSGHVYDVTTGLVKTVLPAG
jgi:carbonic anhydrase